MADTVQVTQLYDGVKRCEYEFVGRSDGTGESLVKKIDLSALIGLNGTTSGGSRPIGLVLIGGDWELIGYDYITLFWDRTAADEEIAVIADSGGTDLSRNGGKQETDITAAGTGDVLLTTSGATATSAYRIRVEFRKKYA